MTNPRTQSTMVSITIHTCLIALLLLASKQMTTPFSEIRPTANVAALIDPFVPKPSAPTIGGGGGQHKLLPATAGHLPKIAPQFVPPTIEITNLHPKLAMEMSIEEPPDTAFPDRALTNIGDPLSKLINGSAGTGGPQGVGNSQGTGIGNKHGPAAGAADNTLGTVYHGGNGVTLPVLIRRIDPEFSEEARRAKHSGVVLLHTDVDATGHARNIKIVQSLGMGLDEKAAQAVSQWLFKPGTKDGKPVAVSATVEVRFQLL